MRRASSAARSSLDGGKGGVVGGGPVECCHVPLAAPSQRYVAVQLVTSHKLFFAVEAKARVKELRAQVCRHLSGMGMVASELLGLAVMQDDECLFIDPESKLAKHAPKNWRSPNNYGLDSEGNPTLVLHIRVQFYVDSPLLLRDPVSRLHYYLQLRHNLLQVERACPDEERLLRMMGCALQADLGDFCPARDRDDEPYFDPCDFVPQQAVERLGKERLVRAGTEHHLALRGVSTSEAQTRFINEASTSSLNLQLHRLQRVKKEVAPSAWLGVCSRGIDIFEEIPGSAKTVTESFQWVHIANLCFERKKFEVRAVQEGAAVRRSFYTGSAERSRQLLLLCRAVHQFSMALGPRLAQLKREHEEAERKRLRDCSLVPRRIQASVSECLGGKSLRSEQRESVISSASSNTTSGIVSDRVLSFDESEDDLEIEIMINSPPAPISSVESLALEHLQDQEDPTDQESEEEEEEEEEAPRCRAPETPGATEGSSQCSSSGSTVKHAKEASGSSSLELGYSHTAQNSTLSEPETLDYSVTSAQASAGAYPSRAPSVSLTLDSNSDYVQLPPLSSEENYVQFEPSEAEARFITSRPAINVLTAHTATLPTVPTPSYASSPPRVKVTPPPIVVTRNNYLDVRASGAMATVYTRQLSQTQIEQFKRQLCSDVDYVIFPVRDPAVSRQEYADHKLLTRLLPPPYCSSKSSLLYRSAPNVQALCPSPVVHNQYNPNNLAALRCVSTHSLTRSYEVPTPPPPQRTASDDNLLLAQAPPPKPPPRPPPLSSRIAPSRPPRFTKPVPSPLSRTGQSLSTRGSPTPSAADSGVLDIRTLREKSRNLDLPLISALCNDRSLLRQTRGEPTARRKSAGRKLYPRQSGSGAPKTRHTAHKHPTPPIPTTSKLVRTKEASVAAS